MAKTKKNKRNLAVKAAAKAPEIVASAVKFEIPVEVKKDILAVVLFTLGFFNVLIAMGMGGALGDRIFGGIVYLFGWGFWMIPLLLFAISIFLIKGQKITPKGEAGEIPQSFSKTIALGAVFFLLSFYGLLNIMWTPDQMVANVVIGRGGGYIGLILALPLVKFFNGTIAFFALFSLLVISLLLIFNLTVLRLAGNIKGKVNYFVPPGADGTSKRMREDGSDDKEDVDVAGIRAEAKAPIKKINFGQIIEKVMPQVDIKKAEEEAQAAEDPKLLEDQEMIAVAENKKPAKRRAPIKWNIPLDLLERENSVPDSGDIENNSEIIKRTLLNFGIEVEMGDINVGPTVTQYTFRPATGIKLSRITNLANDLALALAAHPLRIEAPIPGKSLVGIEVPNHTIARVRFRSLLENPKFKKQTSKLSIVLGQDVTGNVIIDDLGKMPHLLIAGATGSGKTIGVNTIILSLLYQNSPDQLKFIMVDPKRVELSLYNDIPHLLSPVITEPTKAVNALKWAINEMDRRYTVLAEARVRDIYSYNNNGFGDSEPLPFIVVVIDELADLMMRFGREMEASIVRLAQMSRAVGIHLIISTQRPSVEVITGLIKANITARVAFQVASLVDSRTILDTGGAEKLLGRGDMLYLAQDSHKPKRIQGAFVSEDEIKRVSDYVKKLGESEDFGVDAYAVKEAPSDFKGGLNPAEFMSNVTSGEDMGDERYEEAKQVVLEAKKASASLLQRRLKIGYARAARLLDLLEEQGVIGPADGARPREVYGDMQQEQPSEGSIV